MKIKIGKREKQKDTISTKLFTAGFEVILWKNEFGLD